MTPLHVLLQAAVSHIKTIRPELSEAAIARAAGLEPSALNRAKHSCRPETLDAVLGAVTALTSTPCDIRLHFGEAAAK